MAKPTFALCLIVKNELETVPELVYEAKDYFDAIYITCTYKPALKGFQVLDKKFDNVHVDYFEWVKDFSKARNHNLKNVKETYWTWIDADDKVDFSQYPALAEKMDEDELDVIYLQYDYAQNDIGETIALHWRERIMRTEHPFTWKGALHETCISSGYPRQEKLSQPIIHHENIKTEEEQLQRNVEILEREYEEKDDPRITMYLGHNYYSMGRYKDAIRLLMEHIRESGSEEDTYQSWIRISRCYDALEKPQKAMNACLEAIKLNPSHPQAYLTAGEYELQMNNHKKAIEWVNTGLTKPMPETLAIQDPTEFTYKPLMTKAVANMYIGHWIDASKLLESVLRISPNYGPALKLKPMVDEENTKQRSLNAVKDFAVALNLKQKQKLWDALPAEFKIDPRLQPLRKQIKKPKKWDDDTIVFFCGKTNENWGPDTLDKGMGGSEESVVYTARELTRLGYKVTVYNTRDENYDDYIDSKRFVHYEPWHQVDYRDEFATLIVWRVPELTKGLTAKKLICDLHDVVEAERVYKCADNVDKYFVKSKYHRNLFPNLPDDKFLVVGNGIEPSQFKVSKKEPFTVGYYSSPDRGLKLLLELWPKIKERVPEAKGHWHYGWNTYKAVMGEDALYKRIKQLFEEAEDFEEGERLSHEELADKMSKTKVWAYPTEFQEIHCMTALKAEQSGMIPVVNKVAALQETVTQGLSTNEEHIYHNPKAQEEFVDKVVEALKSDVKITPPTGVSFKDVAKVWADEIS